MKNMSIENIKANLHDEVKKVTEVKSVQCIISTRKPLFLHSSYTCEGANSKKRDSCCFFAVGSTKCVFTVCEKRIVGIPESHSHFHDTKEVYLSIRFGLYS